MPCGQSERREPKFQFRRSCICDHGVGGWFAGYQLCDSDLSDASGIEGDRPLFALSEQLMVRSDYNRRSTTLKELIMSATTSPSGLIIEDLTVGEGEIATSGQRVTVHYTGWLQDGEKFDSSKDRDDPFEFALGAGRVIKGWDEGVQGMKVGGSRKLIVPPALGYGARGAGGVIPPNATLVFEVELLDIE